MRHHIKIFAVYETITIY